MTDRGQEAAGTGPVGATGERFFRALAEVFPVCSASDEFYFFPQVAAGERDWSIWDDFSRESTGLFSDRIATWEGEVRTSAAGLSDVEERVDAELLLGTMKTLREQLAIVGSHRMQPTFHLTVAAIGLGQALESRDREHWHRRIDGLPAFLGRAAECLVDPPALFLEMGVEMARELRRWIEGLEGAGHPAAGVSGALWRFEKHLLGMNAGDSFSLPGEMLEMVVGEHMGCGLDTAGLRNCLHDEKAQMEDLLAREAGRLSPGLPWRAAAGKVPRAAVPGGSVIELYRREVRKLEKHCRSLGLDAHLEGRSGPLEVLVVPPCLAEVRASESYNAVPGHPSRGGAFSVFEGKGGGNGTGRSVEYRMTTAHETWPGHHLLDTSRWSLTRPLRRPLEHPLFYEGWACFAEEMMARTGYFSDPWDRFILAKRRLRRAARGAVDLDLQAGLLDVDSAVAELERAGFRRDEARSAVPKYALRPGYQVCYTLGLVRFLDLSERFGGEGLTAFALSVLEEGEVGFENLEILLEKRRDR